MKVPLKCKKCEKDLTWKEIPEMALKYYEEKSFSKVIQIYDFNKDDIVAFKCPYCNERWDRDEK